MAKRDAVHLETTTTATTLSAGRVGGRGGDVLDTSDSHTGTGKSAESGLSTGAGGLGTVTTLLNPVCQFSCAQIFAKPDRGLVFSYSGADLDVEGVDAELLAAGRGVLSSQHGTVAISM